MRCIESLLWSGMVIRVLHAVIHLQENRWNRHLYHVFRGESECWNELMNLPKVIELKVPRL